MLSIQTVEQAERMFDDGLGVRTVAKILGIGKDTSRKIRNGTHLTQAGYERPEKPLPVFYGPAPTDACEWCEACRARVTMPCVACAARRWKSTHSQGATK